MRILFLPKAEKALAKMNKSEAAKIRNYLIKLKSLSDPRSKGKALVGNRKGAWRYRVGDYRIIVKISKTDVMTVTVIEVGHRKFIY